MDLEILDQERRIWLRGAGVSDPEEHEDESGSVGGS